MKWAHLEGPRCAVDELTEESSRCRDDHGDLLREPTEKGNAARRPIGSFGTPVLCPVTSRLAGRAFPSATFRSTGRAASSRPSSSNASTERPLCEAARGDPGVDGPDQPAALRASATVEALTRAVIPHHQRGWRRDLGRHAVEGWWGYNAQPWTRRDGGTKMEGCGPGFLPTIPLRFPP